MTPQEDDEQRLANQFADRLDGRMASSTAGSELAREFQLLSSIDRVLEPSWNLPERLSGHKILSEIGSGGMGRVFLARDDALGRDVAIKTLHPRYLDNPALRARFMREARAMAHISHPNVVRIYNLGPQNEIPHFVMEHLDGVPLTRASTRLTAQQKAELMRKVVLAVAFLHERGIIHRDLKPANILAGPDLEPKLLDFGLALDAEKPDRLSMSGEIVGTPEYLSPEQTLARSSVDERSDIFSLGAILYELLTGTPPFRATNIPELVRRIRQDDPLIPRRSDASIPKALQNVCLKALEKDPARRYASARDMAADLERFLTGEPVLAAPDAYSRAISDSIERHLRELSGWAQDQIISPEEFDGFRKRYGRLVEREDAWIMEARRLTMPQVSLYFGAWILTVGAGLLTLYRFSGLTGARAILTVFAALLPTAWIGVQNWRRERFRIGIAYLLAACLLLPVAMLVTFEEAGLFSALTQGRRELELLAKLEFPKPATNTQLWWAILLSLPVFWWLRRFTRATVFSLVFAVAAAQFCIVWLLRMGMLDWIQKDPGRFYLDLIPFAAVFMMIAFALESLGKVDDSRYFYPIAVGFTWLALSGLAAAHKPYQQWLQSAVPWTRGQVEYLFLINAGIYSILDLCCGILGKPQVRIVGKVFRFVLPGHVLTSLFLLGANAKVEAEKHIFQWLLPAVACLFVFGSIPKQMKNFFAMGLVFFAIGILQLQQDIFKDMSRLPIVLLISGIAVMIAAANYARIKFWLSAIFKLR